MTTTSQERIIDVATRLFAERGYDATSTRLIGEAAGLNIATVAYHVGGKNDLYREVMKRAHEAQRDLLAGALEDLRTTGTTEAQARAGLLGFVDAYLDFCVRNPHVPSLWMRRWLDEGAEVSDLEAKYAAPLAAAASGVVREVLSGAGLSTDLDTDLLVWTVVWTCHSFCQSGVLTPDGTRLRPTDPAMLSRFRRHLHALVDHMVTR